MNYQISIKIEVSTETDEKAIDLKKRILSAVTMTALEASGVTTLTAHQLVRDGGKVVEEFHHRYEHAMFP